MISNSNAGPAYYVLRNDGKLYSWGNNNFGQLGNNSIGSLSTPALLNTISNIKEIGINKCSFGHLGFLNNGNIHVIKNDLTLWAWGNNEYGELGLGTYGNYYTTPNQVNISNVKKVITSDGITLALKNDGTLWCWGINVFDSLGVTSTHTLSFNKKINTLPKQITALSNVADFDFYYRFSNSYDFYALIILFNNGKIAIFDNDINKKLKFINPTTIPNRVYVSNALYTSSYFYTNGNGDVYTFGNLSFYQGSQVITYDTIPKKMNFLSNINQLYTSNYLPGRIYLTKNDGSLFAMGSMGSQDVVSGTAPFFHSPLQIQTYCNLMVGINETNAGLENIHIYPNPSSDGKIYIFSEVLDIRQFHYRLHDITGKENHFKISFPESGRAEIYTDGLGPGVYFLEIKLPSRISGFKKIIISEK
jgi:alpha-tubulin suppressor-like RCC1 family protein